jgi:hypothetical protein
VTGERLRTTADVEAALCRLFNDLNCLTGFVRASHVIGHREISICVRYDDELTTFPQILVHLIKRAVHVHVVSRLVRTRNTMFWATEIDVVSFPIGTEGDAEEAAWRLRCL